MRGFGFLFDPDNALGRVTGKISFLVMTNLMFIAFSLPLVTIGASYTALCHVMIKQNRSTSEVNPVQEFWFAFKANFVQATISWLLAVIFWIFASLELFWLSQIGGWGLYLQLPIMTMMVMVMIELFYLFPTIAAFDNKLPNLAKNSGYYIMSQPLKAIAVLGLNLIPFTLMLLDQANQPTYVFGFFFLGFATITMLSMKIMTMVFYGNRIG